MRRDLWADAMLQASHPHIARRDVDTGGWHAGVTVMTGIARLLRQPLL